MAIIAIIAANRPGIVIGPAESDPIGRVAVDFVKRQDRFIIRIVIIAIMIATIAITAVMAVLAITATLASASDSAVGVTPRTGPGSLRDSDRGAGLSHLRRDGSQGQWRASWSPALKRGEGYEACQAQVDMVLNCDQFVCHLAERTSNILLQPSMFARRRVNKPRSTFFGNPA